MTRRLLTPGEAAEVVQLPTLRLTRLARAGKVPVVILPGDELRFILEDLWSWVETQRVEVPSVLAGDPPGEVPLR